MNQQLLIIDDDRAIHNLVNAHFANSQTECISALDGAEGVQLAADAKPGAILLDMDMPYLDGMEVCRRLKANPQTREIPIMFLTSDSSVRSKVQGIDMGAIDYMTKPIDPSELCARVHSAFRTASAIESVQSLAAIDESTGVWNRAYLMRQIESTVALASRSRQLVNCCFISIDRFDELALKLAQPGGGDLMRQAAEHVSNAVRLEDMVARYDARTIGVLGIVPDRKVSRIVAERVRGSVSEMGLRLFIEPETVTCSVGSVISRNGVGPVIIRAAERALAEAQSDGNRVVQLSADTFDQVWGDDALVQ